MTINNGEQVLPTEDFEDFANETKEESEEVENQINVEQSINDENVAQLEPDGEGKEAEEIQATDQEPEGESEEPESKDQESEDTEAEAKAETEAAEVADKDARDKEELSKKEKFDRYSRGVQRKINKEVKKRGVLEAENETLRTRLDNIENRMIKDTRDSDAAVLANRLRNATAIKQQLMEDAEYEQVAKVDDDIIQMRIKLSKIEDDTSAGRAPERRPEYGQPQPQPQAQYVPDLQTKWIQGNERFGKDSAYTGYVNSTYDALVEEGYDPESASMYEELNSRTGTAATNSSAADVQEPVAKSTPMSRPKTKPRPQSAPTPNVTQAQRPSSATNGITEADKINMRNWGLDPSDKSVRQEWLQNKRSKK